MSADAARFFQALGDPTRLALLDELRGGERPVHELVAALGCPQPKVSRHLKVLRDAGLVVDRREGREVLYALGTRRRWGAPAREWTDRLSVGMPEREAAREPAREAGREAPAPVAPASRRDLDAHLL